MASTTTTTSENSNQGSVQQPNPIVDPYEFLGITINSDGSITRHHPTVDIVGTSDPSHSTIKDIPLNQSNDTWLRLYVPPETFDSSSSITKLPIIVYYHGGGFIVGSAAYPPFHYFCKTMAVEIPAVVLSVDYRLAPIHRLPAAYHDAVEALHWIKTTDEEWLTKYADFSKCYLMGGSAGGNITFHVPAFLSEDDDLGRLKIQGLILQQPYFGGTERTQSEQRLLNDKVVPINANDLLWELGLPIGADRDHEYCNLTVGGGSRVCDRIKKLGLKVLVSGCDGDPLVDRQMELVKMLKEKGVDTVSKFDEGDCHGIELSDTSNAKKLFVAIRHFISSSTAH